MVVIFKNNEGRKVAVEADYISTERYQNMELLIVKYSNKLVYLKIQRGESDFSSIVDNIFNNIANGKTVVSLVDYAKELKTISITSNVNTIESGFTAL